MNQLELWVPLAGLVKPKGDQDTMAFPACSLSKTPRFSKIAFQDSKGQSIEVSAHPEYGMAQIWDFDFMHYGATVIREMKKRGEQKPDGFIYAHGHDMLKFAGRGTRGKDYEALRAALDRLKHTSVRTNIRLSHYIDPETGEETTQTQYHAFNWLSEWKEKRTWRKDWRTGKNQLISDGIALYYPEWFIEGCWSDQNVLQFSPAYFDLKGGYERFLYFIARKFCGRQPYWEISMRGLYKRSGVTSSYKKFRQIIRKTVEAGNIPDYHFAVYAGPRNERILAVSPHPLVMQDREIIAASPIFRGGNTRPE